jgi:hypothetical protein
VEGSLWVVYMSYEDDFIVPYVGLLEDYLESSIWITKDGVEIEMSDLDDQHLLNIHNMLKRKGLDIPYEIERQILVRKL